MAEGQVGVSDNRRYVHDDGAVSAGVSRTVGVFPPLTIFYLSELSPSSLRICYLRSRILLYAAESSFSLTISRLPNRFLGGVTRTLNVSYLRAVPIGTTVRVFAEVVQAGRTMALLQGRMTSTDGKVVYCTCEHHKVHVPTGQGHLAAKVPWDEEFEKQHAGRGGREGGAKL